MAAIHFFEEDIAYKLKHKTNLKYWIWNVILAEGYKLKELNYIFCSDNYLLNLNKQYLDHDTYTDIVTFDNSEADGVILGDIFISIDRIRENAITYQIEEADELHRVMVHGVLHLLGYGDKETGDKELMTSKEDKYLSRRNFTIGR
jgi:rRNA maturation RNase YbeY